MEATIKTLIKNATNKSEGTALKEVIIKYKSTSTHAPDSDNDGLSSGNDFR